MLSTAAAALSFGLSSGSNRLHHMRFIGSIVALSLLVVLPLYLGLERLVCLCHGGRFEHFAQSLLALDVNPLDCPHDPLALGQVSSLVVLLSTHAHGRSVHYDALVSEISLQRAFCVPPPLGRARDVGCCCIFAGGSVDGVLDFGQEVVVVIDAGRSRQLRFLEICGRVALAIAGCSLLVTLVAR